MKRHPKAYISLLLVRLNWSKPNKSGSWSSGAIQAREPLRLEDMVSSVKTARPKSVN